MNLIAALRLKFIIPKLNKLIEQNKYQEAMPVIEKVKTINPKWFTYERYKSICYLQLGEAEKALYWANASLEKNKENIVSLYWKTSVLHKINKKEEALTHSKMTLNISETNFDVLYLHGFLLSEIGESENAIKYYKKAIALNEELGFDTSTLLDLGFYNSSDASIYNALGFERLQIGEFEKAIDDLDRSIELNDQLSFAYSNKGFALTQLGKLEEALINLKKAIQLDPENAYAYKNLALYYFEVNDKNAALENLEIARKKGFEEKYGIYGNEVNEIFHKINTSSSDI